MAETETAKAITIVMSKREVGGTTGSNIKVPILVDVRYFA